MTTSKRSTTPTQVGTASVVKGGQDVKFTALYELGEHTFRVVVRSDSYVDQSFGKIERWDGTKWREVWSLAGRSLKVENKLAYRQAPPTVQDFLPDVNTLLQRAKEVVRF